MRREINEMKDGKWLTFKGFIVCAVLVLVYIWLPQLIGAFLYINKGINETIAIVIGDIITALLVFTYFLPMLYSHFKDFISNFKTNYKISLKFWAYGFLVMFISNLLLTIFVFPGQIAENEELNRAFLHTYPLIAFFLIVIVAPFMEEMIFRFALRKSWGKNKAFPLVTGLIFGFLHSLAGINSLEVSELLNLLYIIPYGALGYSFGYLYNKTDNICFSMSVHMTHNLISYLLILFIS